MINNNEKIRTVKVVAYNPNWAQQYVSEAKLLKKIFNDKLHSVHHIGSTAIYQIAAKPIIDIMPLFFNLEDIDKFNSVLEKNGYHLLGEYGIAGRRYFWKESLKERFHIHCFQKESIFANNHLLFRDYMNNYPNEAKKYANLKLSLAKQYPFDIESYVNGKKDYITAIFNKINHDPIAADYQPLKDKIELVEYNPLWAKQATEEINLIKSQCHKIKDIQHIGSTSIKGIAAKPIIDIFITVYDIQDGQSLIQPLESLNYQYWQNNPDRSKMFFVKGMPPKGTARTHHIHIMAAKDPRYEMRLLFRDFLNSNADYAKQYQKLKLDLAKFYTYDREAYTRLKSDFITKILLKAGFKGKVMR